MEHAAAPQPWPAGAESAGPPKPAGLKVLVGFSDITASTAPCRRWGRRAYGLSVTQLATQPVTIVERLFALPRMCRRRLPISGTPLVGGSRRGRSWAAISRPDASHRHAVVAHLDGAILLLDVTARPTV
jgi:hypothetical protein